MKNFIAEYKCTVKTYHLTTHHILAIRHFTFININNEPQTKKTVLNTLNNTRWEHPMDNTQWLVECTFHLH